MFDLMKVLPEVTKMLPEAQKFMGAWLDFMNRMGDKLKFIEAMLQSNENRVNFIVSQNEEISDKLTLLMSESNLTPKLQDEVLGMSEADPRNQIEMRRRDVDGNYVHPPVS